MCTKCYGILENLTKEINQYKTLVQHEMFIDWIGEFCTVGVPLRIQAVIYLLKDR